MKKILVIDDDVFMNRLILEVLMLEGFEVECADNGFAGIKLFNRSLFDLVITDIVMPEKDGIETIIAIRQIDNSIPIIAISGGGRIDPHCYLQMACALGASHTFYKPLNYEHFLSAVKGCLV